MKSGKKNILWVETTEMMNIYKDEFRDNEKIKITFSNNTKVALNLAQDLDFDLIISNQKKAYFKNEFTGIQLYNKLRTESQIYTNFILLTSLPIDLLEERPISSFNFHYLIKNSNIPKLREEMYTILNG